jgi:hypothetical protein
MCPHLLLQYDIVANDISVQTATILTADVGIDSTSVVRRKIYHSHYIQATQTYSFEERRSTHDIDDTSTQTDDEPVVLVNNALLWKDFDQQQRSLSFEDRLVIDVGVQTIMILLIDVDCQTENEQLRRTRSVRRSYSIFDQDECQLDDRHRTSSHIKDTSGVRYLLNLARRLCVNQITPLSLFFYLLPTLSLIFSFNFCVE